MNLLPKNRQKRNQLFLTLGATVVVIAGIAFGLIHPQYAELSHIRKQTSDDQAHLKTFDATIRQSSMVSNELARVSSALSVQERDLATGDIYVWTIDTIHHFKANYRVDVPDIGQPTVEDEDLFPHFPYKQLRFSLRGTGYYHDIGKFIADFENKYPHVRVVNLNLSPVGGDSEKLAFSMDIIALVKSS